MRYAFNIKSDIHPFFANNEEYIDKTICIDTNNEEDAFSFLYSELSEDKIPNSFLPLTVTISRTER